MSNESDNIVTLCVVGTEVEATMIADALSDRGIEARPSGTLTGGFRAEAPGRVGVLVHASDYARAKAALKAFEDENLEVDWSKVDIGDPD